MVVASCTNPAGAGRPGGSPGQGSASVGNPQQVAAIQSIMRDAIPTYHLQSIIVRATIDGKALHTGAMGESMTGVPATPDMHFRNGAVAFTYLGTMLLQFVDQKRLSLDDKLSKFLPALPNADQISLKMLANMTSGYADYVYEPEVMDGTNLNPFRQWTSEELIGIGTSKPMFFAPGTNWAYSHTNYVILGRVLEKVAERPMAQLMKQYILNPLGLTQTQSAATAQVAQPVLHSFTSERRTSLGVPPGVPFYEESTFWNPSWTTAEGAVQTTDIADLCTTAETVGTGKLLSPASHRTQIATDLIGFGHAVAGCSACHMNTTALSYGIGVLLQGRWITQNKLFAGSGATMGYLPSKKLAVAVVTTYAPAAFDSQGNYKDATPKLFSMLAQALAPDQALPS
ncbi:MAG: serine hydrolase domain-containing protein [Candidatus Dormiibacterota bacterium]